ncbi:HipA family kinase [Acidovorax temperans]|uniref:HipA family kinase n=1 Tax=Acidovorax temperans TaxID=80878 RepID=UPI002899E7D0|nr:HipA family kinase [Acidovorax temperans]
MEQPSVVIEEVLGRSLQGKTLPFICRGDDGETYYVKGAGAGRRSLICEWVAAHLATAFGLPIADYVLAEVPTELITMGVRPDIRELGTGLVFASRLLPHAQELTPTTRDLVPDSTALDVLVFDWWLKNEDRHLTENGGNPNLLWDTTGEKLAVIDHNMAFDPDFSKENFLESHVFAQLWNRVFSDHLLRKEYQNRMMASLHDLPTVRASIPCSWWWVDDGVPALITWDAIATCLDGCSHDDFWNIS